MGIDIQHTGHVAAWEYVEPDSVLRIKQFRHTDAGVVANFLHLQVADLSEAQEIGERIVAILNDKSKISGMSQANDGGVFYLHRP